MALGGSAVFRSLASGGSAVSHTAMRNLSACNSDQLAAKFGVRPYSLARELAGGRNSSQHLLQEDLSACNSAHQAVQSVGLCYHSVRFDPPPALSTVRARC